jgi:hypothetical protein
VQRTHHTDQEWKDKPMKVKTVLTVILLLVVWNKHSNSQAKNYYVDATGGLDANNGLSPSSAWKTLERVNVATFAPGDSILFKRGEIFRGNLVPVSGSALGNITYGAYGTGSKPKLFGSVQKDSLSDWVNEGGNIWHTSQKVVNTVGAELLPNPDFNTNLSGWYEYNYTPNGASAALSRTTVAGEYYTSPGGGKLVCTNHGTTLFSDIQLWTCNCSIDSAKWYKFIFKAKASQQFTIPSGYIKLFQNVSPYATSSTLSKAVLINTSWATYEMYYKSPITTAYGRITFYFGNIMPNGATFYFDSLSFKEVDRDPGLISFDVGEVIFNNEALCGIKVKNDTDLNAQGKFWYDLYNANLKIYSVSNPALFYSNIEIALTQHLINEDSKSYVTYDNLDLRYGAAHGIGGSNTHHIWIKDLDFSWIGGGFQPGLVDVRYGNGVEFWCAAHDNIVERCTFNQIYDAAYTVQGKGKVYEAYNIYFRNNIVSNCESSYEFWGDPAGTYIHDIYFENNTCLYAGFGWGHAQRPDPEHGTHLMFWGYVNEQTKNIYIRNNIFLESSNYGSRFDGTTATIAIVDYNCWYESSGAVAQINGTNYNYSTQWAAYQKASKHDAHSVHVNPLLNPDYTLTNNSPCIDSGITTLEVVEDYNRAPRPQGKQYDIGAFESTTPTTSVEQVSGAIPREYELCQNFPNPFNPTTTISFSLPSKSFVSLNVFDLLGREVTTIIFEEMPAGNYSHQWNAANMSSGIYFYRLQAGSFTETKKLVLIK